VSHALVGHHRAMKSGRGGGRLPPGGRHRRPARAWCREPADQCGPGHPKAPPTVAPCGEARKADSVSAGAPGGRPLPFSKQAGSFLRLSARSGHRLGSRLRTQGYCPHLRPGVSWSVPADDITEGSNNGSPPVPAAGSAPRRRPARPPGDVTRARRHSNSRSRAFGRHRDRRNCHRGPSRQ
jgi:hypothetical protein